MITITLVLSLFLDMEKNGAAPENTEEGADESLVIDEEKNNSDGKTLNFDISSYRSFLPLYYTEKNIMTLLLNIQTTKKNSSLPLT